MKLKNNLTIFNNDVVGGYLIDNFVLRWFHFSSAANLEELWMLQYQIVPDVSQLGGRFNCQTKQSQ
jgi:hypothetical protein